jgi:hypothetical protein
MALSHASAACEGGGEALTGVVRAGLLSREIVPQFRVLTCFLTTEGHAVSSVSRELLSDPARSKNPGTYEDLYARESGDPVLIRGVVRCLVLNGSRGGAMMLAGREGNAFGGSPR